ncbi:MAG: adenosylcobinamide kinase/adenosylcobinamide-phosphate guanylyltransferase [Clostridiales bacterium]|nr:adenosylcobinamide kinase/adenosylcobinamide-phosphate guanylyltransferase [Clostridiales bacterium]
MNIFISGGCKNGKSLHAQRLAQATAREKNLPLYYIATMIPKDAEDDIRIERHIEARRGWGFRTLEQPVDLCGCLDDAEVDAGGVFLMDSVTALLSNEMFKADGSYDKDAGTKVAAELADFAARTGNTVFVSDYIYSDAREFDEVTENYRRSLAFCDRELAKVCDQVIEVSFGVFKEWK